MKKTRRRRRRCGMKDRPQGDLAIRHSLLLLSASLLLLHHLLDVVVVAVVAGTTRPILPPDDKRLPVLYALPLSTHILVLEY